MIKVVLVDDSAAVRQLVVELFGHLKDMQLCALFANPLDLPGFLKVYQPDVLVLDIEMPEMDGITLLKRVMVEYDIPTIMFSSHSPKGSSTAMQALSLGAVGVVSKDGGAISASDGMWDELVNAIRCAASADMSAARRARRVEPAGQTAKQATKRNALGAKSAGQPQKSPSKNTVQTGVRPKRRRIIAIGASTGGTHALEQVLGRLGPTGLPVLVVQHMPAHFTNAFAKRLDSVCELPVKEAADGVKVKPDEILIAPGGKHLRVIRKGLDILTEVKAGPPVSHHCPSVDVLFDSIADIYGSASIGVLMTGMGEDGANGMARLYERGAFTIAQDQATSVVFGMPAAAIKKGVVSVISPLDGIAHKIMKAVIVES